MEKEQKWKKKFIDWIIFITYSFILYFAVYFMQNEDISISWKILSSVLTKGMQYFVVGYGIMLSMFLLCKSIIRDSFYTNIVITIPVLVITIISYYKMEILEQPFIPNDIFLAKNINQIAEFGLRRPPAIMIIALYIVFINLIVQYFLRKYWKVKEKISFKTDGYRIIFFVTGLVLLFVLCILPKRFSNYGMKSDLRSNYFWMGGASTFFIHLGDFYYEKPENYNEEYIRKMQEETDKSSEVKKEDDSIKPNVIMIMNESFSDPNKITNITYSVDPIEKIKELSKTDKNCILGETVSPVLGGGTSLPEYEALTGLSSYYLEKQIFPFTSYIRGNMNSIVRNYHQNNYTTIGIHTNTKTFYNRKNVYSFLGFDKSIFSEDIKNPEIKGGNISDNELANQIMQIYEKTEGNKYIFGLSMQNHMPYENKQYDHFDVEIETDEISDEDKKALQNYLQGVYDGDKMFLKLVNWLKNMEEPTILVMFGDHLPALLNYSLYKQSGFKEIDFYTTPYVVWANYNMDKSNFVERMSPSNLSIQVMKKSNISIPWYFNKMEELYSIYPAINNQVAIDTNGNAINLENIQNFDIINDNRIIQYDILIKKRFINIE